MQTKQKIHKYRSCGIQLKQCLEGNLQLLVPVLREETAHISNLKKLEKEEKEEARKEKNKPITNRRKEIMKTRM